MVRDLGWINYRDLDHYDTQSSYEFSGIEVNDILNIQEEGFSYKLPDECIGIISRISEEVGAPTYIRTPTFPKPTRKKNSKSQSNFRKCKRL